MKSLREWVEENNLNEIFGLFGKPKPKAQGTAPAVVPPTQEKAWCPFCNAWSAVEEDAYYPKGLMVWGCTKCKREWDSKTVAAREKNRPDDYAERGTAVGTFLHKNDVKPSNPGMKESLYLSGLISEEAYYEADMQPQQGAANNTMQPQQGAANLAGKSELGQNTPVGQQELSKLYPKGKVMNFIKNTPVALMPFKNLEQMFGAEKAREIAGMAGAVDKTSYDQTYQQNGYVVFQYDSKGNKPDIYIADPGSVSKNYTKFEGQPPTDPKSRGKIPSLVVLDKLGLDANKVPFFVKKVPTEMISADEVGLANKVIQTSWGEQTVQSGGFLVREPNGHIYTVAPDASGLPIGYIKA
jgi:hypothetical protein